LSASVDKVLTFSGGGVGTLTISLYITIGGAVVDVLGVNITEGGGI
jgi:hypothetical protein